MALLPPSMPKQAIQAQSPLPSGTQFPPNLAGELQQKNPELMRKMTGWLVSTYILPQIMERMPYEFLWDKLLKMYRIKYNQDALRFPKTAASDESKVKNHQIENMNGANQAQVSDSLVY